MKIALIIATVATFALVAPANAGMFGKKGSNSGSLVNIQTGTISVLPAGVLNNGHFLNGFGIANGANVASGNANGNSILSGIGNVSGNAIGNGSANGVGNGLGLGLNLLNSSKSYSKRW